MGRPCSILHRCSGVKSANRARAHPLGGGSSKTLHLEEGQQQVELVPQNDRALNLEHIDFDNVRQNEHLGHNDQTEKQEHVLVYDHDVQDAQLLVEDQFQHEVRLAHELVGDARRAEVAREKKSSRRRPASCRCTPSP